MTNPIVNSILASVRHILGTYIATIPLSPKQKKEISQGLRQLSIDIIEAGEKGFAEGLSKEEE